MGFRDFISDWYYRRNVQAYWHRLQTLQPPANPSRKYIDRLVENLLHEQRAELAARELGMIGAAAKRSLVAASRDPRFLLEYTLRHSAANQPFETVLRLLVPHDSDAVSDAARIGILSPSEKIRKISFLHLASLGRADTVPLLAEGLNDPDGYVRSYIQIGSQRAFSEGRAEEAFLRSMYDLLLTQCDQDWGGAMNSAAEAVVELDPARATIDFSTGLWLRTDNRQLTHVLKACVEGGLVIAEKPLRAVLDHSIPLCTSDDCYPHDYIVRSGLKLLCRVIGENAKPLLDNLEESPNSMVRTAAIECLGILDGIADPIPFVIEKIGKIGLDQVLPQQRTVYFAFLFDAEVRNGGLLQFFGNSSGDHSVETLDALRELDLTVAHHVLDSAMKIAGPLSRSTNRELRLTAFEGEFEHFSKAFDTLESEYYSSNESIEERIHLFARQHPEQFKIAK